MLCTKWSYVHYLSAKHIIIYMNINSDYLLDVSVKITTESASLYYIYVIKTCIVKAT